MSVSIVQDTHSRWASIAPYSYVAISANQRYEYDDIATGQFDTLIPGSDSTATITRTINFRPPFIGWWYSRCTGSRARLPNSVHRRRASCRA